jgi:outer membrane lipoprotein-sorting protein
LAPSAASAVSPDSTDAKAIMASVENRTKLDRVKGRIVMSITDKAGRKRQRTVRSTSMLFEGGARQLMLFESPADVRNTGLLSIDYDDGAKDDDQWLYLPSLHKSTRISSGQKSGSFMGTDLSYADMTQSDPSHYDYKIVKQSAQAAGEACWVIESRPTSQKAKDETGYVKTHVWISKAKMLPIQVKAWVREGRKLKYIKFGDIKQLGGVWTPHKIMAKTVRGKEVQSTTVIQISDQTVNNADVVAEYFTQRQLEAGL